MLRHRYAALLRPPGPGAVPCEGRLAVGFDLDSTPSGRHAWGWVEYSRELTEEEQNHYDLEYLYTAQLTREQFPEKGKSNEQA